MSAKAKFVNFSDADIEKIAAKFDRTSKSIKQDVTQIQDWMKTQPHLPEILGEQQIRFFLFLNKCSIEKTKQKIDMYYTIRSLIPDMYENINPRKPGIQEMMDAFYTVLIPDLTEDLYRVNILKFRRPELVDKINPRDALGCMLNCFEIRLQEDVALKDVFILDCAGVSFNYITKITPTILYKTLTIYNKVFSMRLAGLYIINAPSFINGLLNMLKAVMKPKIFERVHICKNCELLDEVMEKRILPRDYGGDGTSIEELHSITKEKIQEYQWRFDELDTMKVDEKLRPEKLQNDEILGFHGNFKRLDVD